MDSDQLREYKREKSRLFNAKSRELRLKEKKRISDNQPDQQPDQQDNTIDKQPDNTIDKQDDNLTLQDLMDIYETLDTKMDLIDNKLESIIETKLETKLETNTLLPQPSIFFA